MPDRSQDRVPGMVEAVIGGVRTSADRIVQAWLAFIAFLVLCMIVVGGATRLTDSGLSITEWQPILGAIPPLSEEHWLEAFDKYRQIPEYHLVNKGMSLEDFKFIYWWEWGHRFLGRIIGLAFAVPLAVFAWRGMLRQGALPKYLGVLALGGLQGAIGWFMVSSGLVDRVDVSHYRLALHLSVAFLILGLLVWLAMELRDDPASGLWPLLPAGAANAALIIVALVYAQVALGAFVAGLKAGLAYNTWPLMNGQIIPEDLFAMSPWLVNFVENATTVQFNHRLVAYILVGLGLWHCLSILRSGAASELRVSALLLGGVLLAQMVLGIITLLNAVPIGLGVAHQGFAAIVLIVAVRHLWLVRRATQAG
ncbi:MAG: COX15/CtaA family protein [Anaerolineae bacterium]|nr:COX15/CtaA family protein [Anaerolineae bacterium]